MQKIPPAFGASAPRSKRWRWGVILGTLSVIYIISHFPVSASQNFLQWIEAQRGPGVSPTQSASRHLVESRWANPVGLSGTLTRAFGWSREHGSMLFSPGVTINLPHAANVMAPSPAQVSQIAGHAITLTVSGIRVQFRGLSRVFVHQDQQLARNQIVGRTPGQLTIVVSHGQLPVNPLTPEYFGTQWIHR
ncbi:MAG: hypothetical protein M1294_12885 [Firmicutes bacterium]|jgi:hypothetical protein|uniref:Uncharacterized protein n=1 Tax=Sulfobacillus benefaciens TaxID=453960 RepID=A0A2T2WZT2_9FIRM|nr:hypothetical protein [Bacillota bacterium]MCL5013604.1 hypothetical protein [Bacillota bacterium]PSR27744.1 MAG: hypothetical protein C7B43_11095 [Sulfobacillus benefaciens]